MAKKCKYYREDDLELFESACMGEGDSFHEEDVFEWNYCPNCGREIKIKEGKALPEKYRDPEF